MANTARNYQPSLRLEHVRAEQENLLIPEFAWEIPEVWFSSMNDFDFQVLLEVAYLKATVLN